MVEQSREDGVGGRRESAVVSPSSRCYESPLSASEAPANFSPYPSALAKYQDVAANRQLFMDTLEKLHATMGTKFMIPIIGGKELDLHRLFVEVTSRGGIEKIIRERRWKDVTAVFNFPSTATNASFVLRKYYVSLLHHYEQIYLFQAKGWIPPAASPPSSMVCPVVGVIDGKFEHGYLVTVTVGMQKLKGVLYHTTDHPDGQMPQYSSLFENNTAKESVVPCRRRRRKKSELRKRDPAHPKPNRSGYNFFFAEQHARLKPLHPGKDREISKMIGDLWNKLTETEKSVYQEQGIKDKERYRSEMEVYRERLRTGKTINNIVPIPHTCAVPKVMMEEDVKTGAEEGNSFHTQESDSSSAEIDSEEEKSANKELEMEASPTEENVSESGTADPGTLAEDDG
ncbi:PREDICTED: high mobility group B protein 15-like isoform X2 [Nelumbo nucifera]|uniref:High mobility group B protein 15-like isoform X2 n=1 Tax=Nelumbo nucifera TaxID=4432 RepID=A0A1U8B0B7_NELNU|nr:PREDICTED: high mobility group B protein 15-like isoform X2 [Nelumbo nucifera]